MERLPITGLPAGQIPPAVMVCGDPSRAEKAASFLDLAEVISVKREYTCITGQFEGMSVAVCARYCSCDKRNHEWYSDCPACPEKDEP